tara:strand:+ start:12581 stop:12982 length:402 start_codon:yes stop_codon:yes gene_type:complete
MIDTDKYEGHTEGPWKWLKDSILLKGRAYATNRNAYVDSFIIGGRHLDGEWPIDDEANAQLIADAPLLLAEVKRLREILEWMTDSTEPPEGWGQKLPPDGTAWPWPPSDYAMNEIARLALEGKTYLEIWEGLQ